MNRIKIFTLMVDDCCIQDLLCYRQALKSQFWLSCSASIGYEAGSILFCTFISNGLNSTPLSHTAQSLVVALNGPEPLPEMLCGLVQLQSI